MTKQKHEPRQAIAALRTPFAYELCRASKRENKKDCLTTLPERNSGTGKIKGYGTFFT
jgi:hypothetical protein